MTMLKNKGTDMWFKKKVIVVIVVIVVFVVIAITVFIVVIVVIVCIVANGVKISTDQFLPQKN